MPGQLRPAPLWLCQTAAAALAVTALWLWPVDGKATLLIPLSFDVGGRLAAIARGQGADIVRAGPAARWLIVQGPEGFAGSMLERGVLPVKAAAAGCGSRS